MKLTKQNLVLVSFAKKYAYGNCVLMGAGIVFFSLSFINIFPDKRPWFNTN